jgi:hypothetical protein
VLRASRTVRGLGKGISGKPYPCNVQMQGGCGSNPGPSGDLVTVGSTLPPAPGPPFNKGVLKGGTKNKDLRLMLAIT